MQSFEFSNFSPYLSYFWSIYALRKNTLFVCTCCNHLICEILFRTTSLCILNVFGNYLPLKLWKFFRNFYMVLIKQVVIFSLGFVLNFTRWRTAKWALVPLHSGKIFKNYGLLNLKNYFALVSFTDWSFASSRHKLRHISLGVQSWQYPKFTFRVFHFNYD